ncbi:hypothetical protein NKR23_g3846 [Pleurostoma richardsiae]|uniref:Zn(2)-C6 fungal-type domain-containing protein n=1 Tax=Pleurostoma richardsiae TaxID=41990 RepID=A0AA38RXZ9_9PEZI|nr:hypothetical protein NKR23_g3846 [Pleurostoma richardsiae]
MSGVGRTRLACDRCHSQKLRCPKQPGSLLCTRCLKAGAACVYSPAGGGYRAFGLEPDAGLGHPPSASGLHDPSPEATTILDWSSAMPYSGPQIDAALLTGYAPAEVRDGAPRAQSVRPEAAMAQSSSADASSGGISCILAADDTDKAQAVQSTCTRLLAALLVEMDTLWSQLPPQSALHFPAMMPSSYTRPISVRNTP